MLLLLIVFSYSLISWESNDDKVSCCVVIDGITGKWVGTLRSQGAEFPPSYVFKVDGNKLTGTGLAPAGDFDLTNCVIKDNDFSFDLLVGEENVRHTCKYFSKGDSVSVNIFFDNTNLHATLLRSK
jgi:hypothetical protein